MLGLLGRGALGTAKAAFGGGGRRMLAGTFIGAGIGTIGSDANSATGRFRDAASGAAMGGLIGLGVGAATTKGFWKGLYSGTKGLARGATNLGHTMRVAKAARGLGATHREAWGLGREAARKSSAAKSTYETAAGLGNTVLSTGKNVGKAALSAGTLAFQNPIATATLAAGGLGAAALIGSGPGESNVNSQDMSRMIQAAGTPSTGFMPGMGTNARQSSRAMFMDSAQGLVQGLHQGRH